MKPETGKNWTEALTQFRRSEQFLRDKKFIEAKNAAFTAVLFARFAMADLAGELGIPELREFGKSVMAGEVDQLFKQYTPNETVEWARKTLKYLSDQLPPNTFEPFRG